MSSFKKTVLLALAVFMLITLLCGCSNKEESEDGEDLDYVAVVEGDFEIDITFSAEAVEDDDNCAWLDISLGEDVLTIWFCGDLGVGESAYHAKLNGEEYFELDDGSTFFMWDCFDYTKVSPNVDGKHVYVKLIREGNRFILKAEKNGFLKDKLITDFDGELDIPATSGTVTMGADNLILSNIQWQQKEYKNTEYDYSKLSSWKLAALIIGTIVISLILFLFVYFKVNKWLEDAAGSSLYFPFAVVAVLLLGYGGIMVFSWFNIEGASSVLDFVNRIYFGIDSSLSIPMSGNFFASKFVVIASIVIGLFILIFCAILEYEPKVIPFMLLLGFLGLITVYPVAFFIVGLIAELVSTAISILVLLIIFIPLFSGGSDPSSGPNSGVDSGSSSVPQILRMNGEIYRVSHGGNGYLYIYPDHGDSRSSFRVYDSGNGCFSDDDNNSYFAD